MSLGVHQGLVHVNEKGQKEKNSETLGTRIIQMAFDFAIKHDIPSILVLDAFFPWSGRIQTSPICVVRQTPVSTAYFDYKSQEELCGLF